MTIEQFSRQTYWYPVLWYVFATIVAFIAAILFWQKGSSSAEGTLPGTAVGWKFTGAGAVFVVVLLLFSVINPLKPFSDYKKVVIVCSNEDVSSPTAESVPLTITRANFPPELIVFDDPVGVQIELIPFDFIYVLKRAAGENAYVTTSSIPKGHYRMRLASPKTGESWDFVQEVK